MFINKEFSDLQKTAYLYQKQYAKAEPFPHIMLDNFFDEIYLDNILKVFPDLSSNKKSIKFNNQAEIKLATKRGEGMPSEIRNFLRYLNSHEFIDFLQVLTSLKEPLIPDPHFIGGGLHEMKRGGLLKIHADFCRHPETNLDRRLNLLLYLNKNWKESYGGEIQLWNKEMKSHIKFLPIFNRLVIFNTNDYTYHGLPDPINCPSNMSRKSLAVYYFSNGRPSSELRPKNINQSSIFVRRPNEKFEEGPNENFDNSKIRLKIFLKQIMPPILFNYLKKYRK